MRVPYPLIQIGRCPKHVVRTALHVTCRPILRYSIRNLFVLHQYRSSDWLRDDILGPVHYAGSWKPRQQHWGRGMRKNSLIHTLNHLLRSQHMCIEHIRPSFAPTKQQSIALHSKTLRSEMNSMHVRIFVSHSWFHCRPSLCAHVCACIPCPQVRTIFVLGFPADVKERELQNLLRWLPGYEASQLSMKGDQLMGFVLFQTSTMAMSARDALQVRLSVQPVFAGHLTYVGRSLRTRT